MLASKKRMLWIFVVVYAVMVLYITLFSFNTYVYGKATNIVPFASIQLMWRSQSVLLVLKNIVGNLLLFFPFGLLLPLIFSSFQRLKTILFVGFGGSFLIEVIQYQWAKRIFDVDDIILNGLGALLGWLLVMSIRSIHTLIVINSKKG
ncbi:hypothetical protein A374_13410 [Fictibacillus macauensis ZFHKF-1]|uniref:VanZ-like domain-containing protein n=1 Tax=Fictibacillus macauensis ZFHKF-1 TaxID=1196324 RepID=I8AG93_9BACL|nr:VanZ family protein [Fictibacillus macauensis]EIT84692.1 hypothetical protein A374_13410 [Fictibacillus macauensis ZFHKF-1]